MSKRFFSLFLFLILSLFGISRAEELKLTMQHNTFSPFENKHFLQVSQFLYSLQHNTVFCNQLNSSFYSIIEKAAYRVVGGVSELKKREDALKNKLPLLKLLMFKSEKKVSKVFFQPKSDIIDRGIEKLVQNETVSKFVSNINEVCENYGNPEKVRFFKHMSGFTLHNVLKGIIRGSSVIGGVGLLCYELYKQGKPRPIFYKVAAVLLASNILLAYYLHIVYGVDYYMYQLNESGIMKSHGKQLHAFFVFILLLSEFFFQKGKIYEIAVKIKKEGMKKLIFDVKEFLIQYKFSKKTISELGNVLNENKSLIVSLVLYWSFSVFRNILDNKYVLLGEMKQVFPSFNLSRYIDHRYYEAHPIIDVSEREELEKQIRNFVDVYVDKHKEIDSSTTVSEIVEIENILENLYFLIEDNVTGEAKKIYEVGKLNTREQGLKFALVIMSLQLIDFSLKNGFLTVQKLKSFQVDEKINGLLNNNDKDAGQEILEIIMNLLSDVNKVKLTNEQSGEMDCFLKELEEISRTGMSQSNIYAKFKDCSKGKLFKKITSSLDYYGKMLKERVTGFRVFNKIKGLFSGSG